MTGIFLLSIAGALLVWELVMLALGKKLISPVVYETATRYPFVPFLLGFLMGHLLWPQ